MADTEQRYDAFISYRHIQPDRSVAERIHRKLEAFRLPKEIASKIGTIDYRCFETFRISDHCCLSEISGIALVYERG